MPGFVSTYARKRQLDHRTGVQAYTPPPTLWLALTILVLSPGDQTIPAGVELVGGGYVAQPVANDSSVWTPAAELVDHTVFSSNLVPITFAQATADYTAANGWALVDAASGGNVWEAGPWEGTPIQPRAGEIPTVGIGQILRRSLFTG